ncbi:MAG: hypothetical protein IK016_05425 [Lachnospiraceae bacterium]|nr:hypothetical protein [Lachnospiraceae bacterium]
MKKYLVDVYLPAVGKHFDVYLPASKLIGEVTSLLITVAVSVAGKEYIASEHAMLIRAEDGAVLDTGVTVYDAGIRNAAKLILI